MPARETVAGVAYLRSRISKIMRMCALSGMRSFDARVSILLSSITEFIDSIQLASRSPSSTIHFIFVSGMLPRSRIMMERRPSFHSRVAIEMWPYRSSVGTTFGFRSTALILAVGSRIACAFWSIFQTVVLPAPAGPMIKTQCRMSSSSCSWTHLRLKLPSGQRPASSHARSTASESFWSTIVSGLRPGKRSFRSPRNITSSAATILGILKSRSARMSRMSSARSGWLRLSPPATTRTDLTARRPQS
mmetsp:Transcript_47925/g.133614  ORF Transcript_47925/g.133614 Transcript_47925/m.133614 type:complete len:247 (+) Transcript_47925:2798-3538(+)